MEIFWVCGQCKEKNNYMQTQVCSGCGAKIDRKTEVKCLYEMGGMIGERAASSKEFFLACQCYEKIIDYKDARLKHSECKFKAERVLLNEQLYEEAKAHFKSASEHCLSENWSEAIDEFANAERKFQKNQAFLDSKECASQCRHEAELCRSKQIYLEAKRIFISASDLDEYKRAAELFSKILDFADAKENHQVCQKFIHELSVKKQLELLIEEKCCVNGMADLDKKILRLQRIVAREQEVLSDEAEKIMVECKALLQDCLKRKKEIQTIQHLEEATKKYSDAVHIEAHALRLNRMEEILKTYGNYDQAPEFKRLFEKCKKEIAETRNYVDYQRATDLMTGATTAEQYQSAADLFSGLGSFMDADTKKDECDELAADLRNAAAYRDALEMYEKGRKINIFNWRKYL